MIKAFDMHLIKCYELMKNHKTLTSPLVWKECIFYYLPPPDTNRLGCINPGCFSCLHSGKVLPKKQFKLAFPIKAESGRNSPLSLVLLLNYWISAVCLSQASQTKWFSSSSSLCSPLSLEQLFLRFILLWFGSVQQLFKKPSV